MKLNHYSSSSFLIFVIICNHDHYHFTYNFQYLHLLHLFILYSLIIWDVNQFFWHRMSRALRGCYAGAVNAWESFFHSFLYRKLTCVSYMYICICYYVCVCICMITCVSVCFVDIFNCICILCVLCFWCIFYYMLCLFVYMYVIFYLLVFYSSFMVATDFYVFFCISVVAMWGLWFYCDRHIMFSCLCWWGCCFSPVIWYFLSIINPILYLLFINPFFIADVVIDLTLALLINILIQGSKFDANPRIWFAIRFAAHSFTRITEDSCSLSLRVSK